MDLTLQRAVERIVAMAPERPWETYVARDGSIGRVGTRSRWIVQLVSRDGVELSARRPRERRGERLVQRVRTDAELDALGRDLVDLMQWWADRLTVHSFVEGRGYRVERGFVDYTGQAFHPGEELAFVEQHFLPHDGGHTLVFRRPDGTERRVYLQEDAQGELIEDLDAYPIDV